MRKVHKQRGTWVKWIACSGVVQWREGIKAHQWWSRVTCRRCLARKKGK